MKGKRRTQKQTKYIKKRCKELRAEGLNWSAIGRKLKLDHTTCMWHCGILNKIQ